MKKRTKTLVVLLAASCLCLTAAGCSKTDEGTAGQTKTNQISTEESAEVSSLEGVLISFIGKELTIEANGSKYSFDLSDANIQAANMVSGDDIIVCYKGSLKKDGAQNVKVVSIEDKGQAPTQQQEKTAVGTLVQYSENSITIRQNDATQLIFNSNNCEHVFKNGLREGNWIIVTYLGDIVGTDTHNIKVLRITDNDSNPVQEEQKSMEIKAVDETVYATAGVYIRSSCSTDAAPIGSLAKGSSIHRSGICANGWSRVTYNDEDAYIYGDYLTTTAPAEEAPAATTGGEPPKTEQQGNEPAPVQTPQEQPQEQHNIVTGKVVEVSMNTLTFQTDEQAVYTINIADAAHEYKNGIQTGNSVTITYTGDLSDLNNIIVISVKDDDPNTSAENAVYTGTIVDGTMNTFTIQTKDKILMTFSKESSVDNTNGLLIGTEVSVTVDTATADDTSTIMEAKQIDLTPAAS